jgi:hypothetical protein
MGLIDEAIRDAAPEFARELLTEALMRKFQEAGVTPARAEVDRFVRHGWDKNPGEFVWSDARLAELNIGLSKTEWRRLDRNVAAWMNSELPGISEQLISETAATAVRSMRRRSRMLLAHEADAHAGFRRRLEKRWGKALDALRLLKGATGDFGQEFYDAARTQQDPAHRLRNEAKLRLHMRACQLATEIITLLENGLADGAFARWRTLQEIYVVMQLISRGDEDLAQRYLVHEVIDEARAMDDYAKTWKALGHEPPDPEAVRGLEDRKSAAIAKYGKSFGGYYGWAAKHLGLAGPRVEDIAATVGEGWMAAYTRLASHNVHAAARAVTTRLSALDGAAHLPVGFSNAGLEEPGQNTAIVLVKINGALFGLRPDADQAVRLKAIADLRDIAVKAFIAAARKLRRDHSKI